MAEMTEDPFDAVHEEVKASVAILQKEHDEWNSGNLPLSALRDRLRALDWDLQDLSEAVKVAQSDPSRFSLTQQDVANRCTAVTKLQAEVQSVEEVVSRAEETNASLSSEARREELLVDVGPGPGRVDSTAVQNTSRSEPAPSSAWQQGGAGASTGYDDEVAQQELLVRQQDEGLEDLQKVVQRIGNMGQEMNVELTEQGDMLDDLESGFGNTRSRMANIQGKLDAFVAETSRSEFCTIAVLFFTFIFLTFLVFAT